MSDAGNSKTKSNAVIRSKSHIQRSGIPLGRQFESDAMIERRGLEAVPNKCWGVGKGFEAEKLIPKQMCSIV
jgi:hypothetical protein